MKILKLTLIIILFLIPSLLSIPQKGREHGGILISLTAEQRPEFDCIRSALWHEARGEPEEGIRAVMSVIHNRKEAKGFPSTFCGVILQPKQFSAFNNRNIETDLKPLGAAGRKAYAQVSLIAHEAVLGAFEPVLEPSVLHYAHKKVKNNWTRKFKVVKIEGSHKFYKEI